MARLPRMSFRSFFPSYRRRSFRLSTVTVGACDMTPLDMVVFVADAIEPNRHGDYAHALRKMVGKSSLDELFFSCFAQGLVYVIQSGRYLYPTAITIYNHYAQLR